MNRRRLFSGWLGHKKKRRGPEAHATAGHHPSNEDLSPGTPGQETGATFASVEVRCVTGILIIQSASM
jgi:hypothetical protein